MQSDQITPPCAQGPHSAACSEVSDGPSSGSRKRPACTLSSSVASINAENRRRRLEGTDTPLARATPSTPPADFIPFGTGMQLPWLPYAFTQTCALCGKTGIQPDTKRLMPLTFLQEFLRRTCARTPFVYNVLYQMAHHPHLEEQEARKWRKMMGRPVPLHLRGRICTCLQCSRPVNDRASSRASRRYISDPPAVGDSSAPEGARPAHQGAAPPPPAAWNARGNAGEDGGDDGVMPLAEAMLASYNADYDDWSIVLGDRITQQQQPFQAGLQGECGAQASYMGEAGRNQGKNVRMMLPMDLVFYMLHAPSGDRVPEYRMLLRLLRNMVSDVDEGGAQRGQKGQRARPAHPCGLPCLYLAFPSIALDMLIMQVQSGRIELKGVVDMGTIADRVHMSAYLSGGKRRVARCDEKVGCVIRRCSTRLYRASLNVGEDGEAQDDDGW